MSDDAMKQIRKAAEGNVSVSNHAGHVEVTAKVLGIARTYVLSSDGGTILGRADHSKSGSDYSKGGRLLGGGFVGSRLTWEEFLSRIGAS